jgi:hypothetical protein
VVGGLGDKENGKIDEYRSLKQIYYYYLIQHGHRSTNFKASGMVGIAPASWFGSVTPSSDSRSGDRRYQSPVGVASPVENRTSSPSPGTRFARFPRFYSADFGLGSGGFSATERSTGLDDFSTARIWRPVTTYLRCERFR